MRAARLHSPRLTLACLCTLAAAAAACGKKEALITFEVQTAADVPTFDQYRFSTPDVPGAAQRHVAVTPDNRQGFQVGLYVSTSGTVPVLAEAVRNDGCVVGDGMATATGVQLGATTDGGVLTISAKSTAACGSADAGSDGASDARGDAHADAGEVGDAGKESGSEGTGGADGGRDAADGSVTGGSGGGAGDSGTGGGGGTDAGMSPDVEGDAPADTVIHGAVLSGTTSHDFGVVLMGAAIAAVPWVVTNIGDTDTGTLQLTNNLPKDIVVTNGCPSSLGPGATCTIQVGAKALGGIAGTTVLRLSASTGSSSVTFTAMIDERALTVNPSFPGVDLGDVSIGSSVDTTFTVSNTTPQTSSPITFGVSSTTTLDLSFRIANFIDSMPGDCVNATTTLASGGTCNVRVRFAPFSFGDRRVDLSANAMVGGQALFGVTAHGIHPPSLVGVTRHNFGVVQTGVKSSDFTWTITNQGDLATGVPMLSNADPTELVVGPNTCTAALASGDSCSVTVAFRPSASSSGSAMLTLSATPGGSITLTANANGPATGTVTLFPFTVSGPDPTGIAPGPDGNVWFTEFYGDKIGRITPSGTIREFSVSNPFATPVGIALGADGNLWFTDPVSASVLRVTPTGSFDAEVATAAATQLTDMIAGPAGILWFIGFDARTTSNGMICALTPGLSFDEEYSITRYPLGGVAFGPDGNVWFTAPATNSIARIVPRRPTPDLQAAIPIDLEVAIPTANSTPGALTVGPDGNLWFVEQSGNNIGRITTTGSITEFAIPTAGANPQGITAGPDGNVWFTEQTQIARITPQGVITEFGTGSGKKITVGPDGNLWSTGYGAILRITP
jgi:streptogramin lyase